MQKKMVNIPVSVSPATGLRLMVICALLDSTVGMLIKMLPWNPFVIAGCRSLIVVVLLLTYYKVNGIKIKISKGSFLAGLMISATFITFISATRMTTAANAVALQFSNPALIVILSFMIFKEKPERRDILKVLGVLIGVILIFGGSFGSGGMTGNILGLLSGLCFAGMFLYNNRVKDLAEHYGALVTGHAITFIASIYFIYAYPPVLNTQTVLSILALGIFQQTLLMILYSYAIRVCKPLTCSVIMMMQLVINPILVFLTIGEVPTLIEALGCLIILLVSLTVLLNNKSQKSKRRSISGV